MLTSYKGQLTVSGRELLTVGICILHEKNEYEDKENLEYGNLGHSKNQVTVLASVSVDDHRIGSCSHGKVRGKVILGGYVIKETPDGCEVISINQVSLGGSLPSMLVTPVLRTKPAEILLKLRDLCR